MPKIFYPLIFILLLVALLSWKYFQPVPKIQLPTIKVPIKNQEYQLEVATTSTEKSQGLSNRQSLCPTCGMLFIFNKDGILPFWMKDTLIPLDMVWLNSSYQVVKIVTAQPQIGQPIYKLTVFTNDIPAQYVIEINAGQSQKIELKVGDTIPFKL